MQRDFSLTDRFELSIWCDWRQPGLGVTSIGLGDGLCCVSLHVLVFGVALTRWPR